MIGGLQRRYVSDRLSVCRRCDELHRGSNSEIAIAVEIVADVAQAVASPSTPGSTGIAADRIVRVARRYRLRIMQVCGSAPGRYLKALERLRYVNASAEGNHELVVTALYRSYVRN